MTDWFTVLGALFVGGLGGSGLTGIATTIYERHEMSKESKREYFNKLILKPEFFRYLTGLTEMYDFLNDLLALRQTGKVVMSVDGKLKTIESEIELLSHAYPAIKMEEAMKQFKESGVYFLLPGKLQTAINNLWDNFPRNYASVTKTDIEKYKVLMKELRECLTKQLGIE